VRCLFTSKTGSLGHLLPLLPLAQAAVEAGDDVAIASGADRRRDVEEGGFRFFPAGLAIDEVAARMRSVARGLTARGVSIPPRWGYDYDNTVAQGFTTVHAPAMAADLERVIADFEPQLLVCDVFEFGAPVAAERAGLPCVSHGLGLPVPERVTREAARWASPMWTDRGLTPPEDAGMYGTLHVSICPPCLDPGDGWTGAPVQTIGPPQRTPVPPDWLLSLPDRPTVYVTLGTARGREAGLLADVIGALASVDVNVVVTVGPDRDPAPVEAMAGNVTAHSFVPQHDLLPSCSAVVCHGGSGTILGALAAGVPVIVLPHMADHYYNANALRRIGCGISLDDGERSPDRIRTAVGRALEDLGIRRAAMEVQADIARMPRPEAVVERIHALVEPS
jgi:UDP:flavonoid glycosyltransferase YjiC (YdhE family)